MEVDSQPEQLGLKNEYVNSKGKISKMIITEFLQKNTAYLSIKENTKLLVFKSELKIKDTLDAFINEELYCGLIWSTECNRFLSLFTIRDILKILKITYEKVIKLCLSGTSWSDTKSLVSLLFQKNTIQMEELDIIMENANSFNSSDNENEKERDVSLRKGSNLSIIDSKDENCNNIDIKEGVLNTKHSDLKSGQFLKDHQNTEIINDNKITIDYLDINQFHKKFNSYSDFFEIFKYMSLHDYLIDLEANIDLESPISVELDDSLISIIKIFQSNNIHRVVLEDNTNKSYCGVVTYETIFEYFMSNYYSSMDEFNIEYTQIEGLVNENIIFSYTTDSIYSCFLKIYENNISSLPIICQQTNYVYGILYIKDILYFFLLGEKFKFNDSISKLLIEIYNDVVDYNSCFGFERVLMISKNQSYSLKNVLEYLLSSPEKKIYIYNQLESGIIITGLITLSDLFRYMIEEKDII